MPGKVAHVLRDQDERRSEFVLHAQAVLRNSRSRIVGVFAVRSLWKQRLGRGTAALPVVAGVGEFDVGTQKVCFRNGAPPAMS